MQRACAFSCVYTKEVIIIDPATARILLYLAQKMIEDEEARKRLFYIMMIPVVLVLLLFSMVHYMFTMPLSALQDFFKDDYSYAEQVINDYGYGYGYAHNGDYILGDYSDYDAIDAELFAKLMDEATKYVGYKYEWGGSDPVSSFDCSGFVCWSYTESGVYNLPRTTAQGIYDKCSPIRKEEAKAGDLVFFKNTTNVGRTVTHLGIYLGDGTMLHAGDYIGYANIETAYWQKIFYGYGRLPIVIPEYNSQGGEHEQVN